jgi:hypothetical protein
MAYLNGFGFEIYRLREAKVENEFLLYNIKTNAYNNYSGKRILEIIECELTLKKIDYQKFIIEELWNLQKEQTPDKKTLTINRKKRTEILQSWIEAESILIDNIGFRPIKDKVYIHNDKTYFNTYCMPDTLDKDNYKLPKPIKFSTLKTKCSNIYKLLSNLHGGCDIALQDTLYKIADKIQNPHEKAQDCIIFYPAEAAGKGIFYKHIIQPIFKDFSSKILMKKLDNDFNLYLRNDLILILEEGKRDLELIETLKEIVTESSMLINGKGTNQQEEEVYFLTFVFSNNMNPIDLGKRRGSYHICKSLGKSLEQSQKVGSELCKSIPNEIEDLLYYLHNLEVEHQKALAPFNTLAKTQVTDLNKTSVELFHDYIITFQNFEAAVFDSHRKRFGGNNIIDLQIIERNDLIYISKNTIKDCYNNFCLVEGFRSNLIKHNKDIVQLWDLMNIPTASHKRILLLDGNNKGRKLDHLELIDLNRHIKEKFEEE